MSETQAGDPGVVLVTGVVHPRGVGGGHSINDGPDEWRVYLRFETWRVGDGESQAGELLVTWVVTEDELRQYTEQIKPYQIVSVRARFRNESVADLEEFIGPPPTPDATLTEHAADLQQPVTREDDQFGTLTLNRQFGTYDTETPWRGRPVRVTFDLGPDGGPDAALNAARPLWADAEAWETRIQDCAVRELLDTKNSHWLGDAEDENDMDPEPLTPAQFKARMSLTNITLGPDGEFTFWYDDGEMFLGHVIMVSGDLAKGPTDANIAG